MAQDSASRSAPSESNVRERILVTASQLFYAQGLRAVGVDTIIATSGVAKATFYRHFPAKDDLIVAFLRRRDELWREWLRTTVERLAPDKKDRPLAVFDALSERFALSDFRGCAFINSMVELADRDHAAHVAADEHKRKVIAYVIELLTEAGVQRAEALARELVLLIDGAIVTAVREGTPDAAASAKRIAAQLLGARSPESTRKRK